jgi:hypothetical protein
MYVICICVVALGWGGAGGGGGGEGGSGESAPFMVWATRAGRDGGGGFPRLWRQYYVTNVEMRAEWKFIRFIIGI